MSNDNQYGGDPAPETPDPGRQTAQQAAITGQGGAGKTDADRNAGWRDAGGEPGRSPVATGGSSQGQADQNDGRGPHDGRGPSVGRGGGAKLAGGLYRTERTGGGGSDADVPSGKD